MWCLRVGYNTVTVREKYQTKELNESNNVVTFIVK
jgi:hypothetical protein